MAKSDYNRSKKRWERTAPCGQLIWTRIARLWLTINLSRHVARCWKCWLLESAPKGTKFDLIAKQRTVLNFKEKIGMSRWAGVHSANGQIPEPTEPSPEERQPKSETDQR